MTTNELHNVFSKIIDRTFDKLSDIYKCNLDEKPSKASRLVFPHYGCSGKLRISEQELRFVFVETFNQYCSENGLELYYSIETPTKNKYDFRGEIPTPSKEGRSAMFDLVIFDKAQTHLALIEFKAGNPNEKSHHKDLLKLSNPKEGSNDTLRYFIEIVENSDDDTIKSLESKLEYQVSIENRKDVDKRIYSLKQKVHLKL